MAELAGDEVGDGNQMAGGAVTAGLGLSGLNATVGSLDAGVGELGIEGVEDAFPVVFERLGDLLDRFDATTSCPAVPALEQRLCALAIGGGMEDLAQRLLDAEGAVGFEIETFEVVKLDRLVVAPIALIFQPDVTGALETGVVFDLLSADLVERLVDQLDDVELVEGSSILILAPAWECDSWQIPTS